MEIQKHLQVEKSTPAKQELQVYQTSNDSAFQLALTDVKISVCDNDAMVQALRYCMLLVGIRANNLPGEIEFNVLKDFIRRHYPGHTVEELRLAFDMAVAGKLELGTDGAKCYENFSCEYVGRILTGYRRWAEQVARVLAKRPPEPKKYTAEEILDININYAGYLRKQLYKKLKKPLK